MGKFSSIVFGTALGAAAALFLTSKKGKEVRAQAAEFIKNVQARPEDFKDQVVQSATDFTNQAADTVNQVKEKVDKGDITSDTVIDSFKETAKKAVNYSQDTFQLIKDKIKEENLTTDDLISSIKDKVQSFEAKIGNSDSEDIIIDLEEDSQKEE